MSHPLDCLSPAERRVIEEILRTGDIAKVVAARIGITRRTLETHRQRAYLKLGIKSIFELGAAAVELGYFQSKLRSRATSQSGLIPRGDPAAAGEGAGL